MSVLAWQKVKPMSLLVKIKYRKELAKLWDN